jgi:NADPH:quinone reductase-like Zn-dependent oxidoreductase
VSTPARADLETLKTLCESGKLRPVIDRTCALQDTPDALRYIEQGHTRGKVVVNLRSAEPSG